MSWDRIFTRPGRCDGTVELVFSRPGKIIAVPLCFDDEVRAREALNFSLYNVGNPPDRISGTIRGHLHAVPDSASDR